MKSAYRDITKQYPATLCITTRDSTSITLRSSTARHIKVRHFTTQNFQHATLQRETSYTLQNETKLSSHCSTTHYLTGLPLQNITTRYLTLPYTTGQSPRTSQNKALRHRTIPDMTQLSSLLPEIL